MPVGLYAGANVSNGNGVTVAFPYNFKILDQTHIEVKVDGVVQPLGAYSVTGVGLSNGGNVVFLVAPANGAVVQRARKVPYKRDQDYQYNGDLREEVVDPDFDTVEMQVQQLAADMARAFKAPLSVTTDQVISDADWAAAAGKYLRRKNDGSGIEFIAASPDDDTFTATGVGAVPRAWSAKVGEVVSVKDFGATGDGLTDDTVAAQKAVTALPVGGGLFFPPGTYLTGGYVTFTNKTAFSLFGFNATIKTKNGQAIASGNGILKFIGCSNGYIAGLVLDGNRANRVPVGEPDSMCVRIDQDCSELVFERVLTKNSVCDGWLIYQNAGVAPADIVLRDCESVNAWRNGCSIVGGNRVTVRGGRYSNTNGTNPQAGIDIEPDAATINTDIVIDGARADNNSGVGFSCGGAGTNTRVSLLNLTGNSNTLGLLLCTGNGGDVIVRNLRGANYANNPTRAVVDFGTGIDGLDVDGIWLKNLTFNSNALNAVYFHSLITGRVSARNIGIDGLICRGVTCNTPDIALSGVMVKNNTRNDVYQLYFEGATRGKAIDAKFHTCSGGGIYIATPHVTVEAAKLYDVVGLTQAIMVDAGGDYPTLNNIEVITSGAKPAGQVALQVLAGVPIKQINGFHAKDNGAGYTSANVWIVPLASMVGAQIENLKPDFLQVVFAWDIPNLAAGAAAFVTQAHAPAKMGDYVDISSDGVLDDGVVTAFIELNAAVPADGFIRVSARNNGTVAFNPANANIACRVRKR